jgi:pimeloyl-ACP methyl ester carboxylesterase
MRYLAPAGVLFFSAFLAFPSALVRQGPAAQPKPSAVVPVPSNVKPEGLPPIPASIPEVLAPYGVFRSAVLLGWHPVRRHILIQTAFGDVDQVHLVRGPGMDRRQVTFGREGVTGGAWYEPTVGSYFVFRKVLGPETAQFFRSDVPTGTTTLLTEGSSRNSSPVWSHRAGLIAFASSRRNGRDRDLYVMDPAKPDSTRLVAEVDGNWSVEGWSPDDRELLAIDIKSTTESYLWRIDVKSGAKTALTPPGEPAFWNWPQYTPDGRAVFAVSDRGSELPRVWRGNVATGSWKPVTRDGDSVESCVLSPDGRTLAVVFDRNASSHLELLDAATLVPRVSPKIPTGQILRTPQWDAKSAEVAFTVRSVRTFADVYSANARTGVVERWTTSESSFNPETLPDPEFVRWKSFDDRMISGVLYRPPARFTGPRPVIINIHGGPNGPMARERPRFQGRSAYFLNEIGIAIVYPNVRGTGGLGKTFEMLDDGLLREGAVKDIGALLDWIGQQPLLDKNRVMVTGASYGGYMTYAVAEAYGDRIRCAYAASGMSNFITYFEDIDQARLVSRRAEYGDVQDPKVREFLTRISPVKQASKLRTPLLIAHGKLDSRVPVSQAEEMYRAAKANGAPAWLVVYEDEGHDPFPAKRPNQDFHFYTWILFVQKYLIN